MTVSVGTLLRLVTAVAVSSALLVASAAPGGAAESDLDRSRRAANEAAAEVAAASSDLAVIEREAAEVEAQAAAMTERLGVLRGALREQAVDRFINGGAGPASLTDLLAEGDIGAVVRADALARSVSGDTDEVLQEYRLASEDLEIATGRLVALEQRAAEALVLFDRRAGEATAELERQVELDAARRRAEQEARAAAERQARAEAAVRAEADRLARERSAASAPAASATRAPVAAPPPTRPPSGAVQRAPSPATEAPPSSGSSGSFRCPVDGPRAFSNDWGQPRSGGRRHQGTDILSPRGTPVVASVSGTARGHQSSLGGISYYLTGDDGNTYFGTHLDSLSGASGRVSQGTVLGYVGDSGNARGGPTHLHFEIHPGGGAAVNPYPTLAEHC